MSIRSTVSRLMDTGGKIQYSATSWFMWEGSTPRFGTISEFTSEPEQSTFTHEGHEYDLVGLLIAASALPTQQFDVKSLDWIFKWDPVDDNNRVQRVDLDAPILVTQAAFAPKSSSEELVVIDGLHRLAKAVQAGRDTIKGIFVDDQLLAQHRLH